MKLIAAALFLWVILHVAGTGRSHNVPGSRHNRVHAITYGFCHTLKPCARGNQALRVATCESNLWPWATNGQFWGLFQMGYWARSQTDWAWGPWAQARAAASLQRRFGWSQWSCASIVGIR